MPPSGRRDDPGPSPPTGTILLLVDLNTSLAPPIPWPRLHVLLPAGSVRCLPAGLHCPSWASPPGDTYAHTPAQSRRVPWPGPFRGPPLRRTHTHTHRHRAGGSPGPGPSGGLRSGGHIHIHTGTEPAGPLARALPGASPPGDTYTHIWPGPVLGPVLMARHPPPCPGHGPLSNSWPSRLFSFVFLSASPACLPPPVPSDPPPRSTAGVPPPPLPPYRGDHDLDPFSPILRFSWSGPPTCPPPRPTAGVPPLPPRACRGDHDTCSPGSARTPSPPLVSPSGGAPLGVQVPVGPALPHLGGS